MTATPEEIERLVEEVAAAWRPRDRDGGVRSHPAWHDLPASERVTAARRALATRQLEAALDPEGLSTTARAVLARILGAGA